MQSQLEIPESEMTFTFSRSSGPGGQNVNKVNTRVTVLWNVAETQVLSDSQKRRIRKKLATRIGKDGILRVVSQKHRTQQANRETAVERLHELVRDALRRKPPRKKTRPPASARRKRLEEKKRRGEIKRLRSPIFED